MRLGPLPFGSEKSDCHGSVRSFRLFDILDSLQNFLAERHVVLGKGRCAPRSVCLRKLFGVIGLVGEFVYEPSTFPGPSLRSSLRAG